MTRPARGDILPGTVAGSSETSAGRPGGTLPSAVAASSFLGKTEIQLSISNEATTYRGEQVEIRN